MADPAGTTTDGAVERLLFVKHTLGVPRAAGHDIRSYEMLRAFKRLGHSVGLATITPASPDAVEGLDLDFVDILRGGVRRAAGAGLRTPSYLQQRFASYWGVDDVVNGVAAAAQSFNASVVVAVGLDALPCLLAVEGATRVWYAGDEWVTHHLSLIKAAQPATWRELKPAMLKGLYERAFASAVDRVWVVAEHEVGPMQRYGGMRAVDVVTNGVDIDYYRPEPVVETPRSAVFWGRLDFGPNIQAMTWLCREVWPRVRAAAPDATLTIIGYRPQPDVLALQGDGVVVKPDVRDIRPDVARHAVVVLPFWSGGGIKNKLLEALAMGRPVVCTPQAARGLRGAPPVRTAASADAWASSLKDLWLDEGARGELARAARSWIVHHHTWEATAREALAPLRAGAGRDGQT